MDRTMDETIFPSNKQKLNIILEAKLINNRNNRQANDKLDSKNFSRGDQQRDQLRSSTRVRALFFQQLRVIRGWSIAATILLLLL